MPRHRLVIEKVGPIESAVLDLADLTILTGPQASGKSVALQLLKLIVDLPHVRAVMLDQGLLWKAGTRQFFDAFLGAGMQAVWDSRSRLLWDDTPQRIADIAIRSNPLVDGEPGRISDFTERVFYIPAQRTLTLQDGATRSFADYRAGDPYVLRRFSQEVHEILQGELTVGTNQLFPKTQRFNRSLKRAISDQVFGGWALSVDTGGLQKELVLTPEGLSTSQTALKYLSWSAGQREFTPLLFGMYKLMPSGGVNRRDEFNWAIIEEPEAGLHPRAVGAVMALVYELLRRGYKVVMSTHSTHVLDAVWGLRTVQEYGGTPEDALDLIGVSSSRESLPTGRRALEADSRVYYFERGQPVQDISRLDPGAGTSVEATWGGLTAFADNVNDVIARVVRRET